MSTAATTPEITQTSPAVEPQAAAQPTPTTPSVEPSAAPPAPQPEWGNISKNTDGSYEVKLATGEVFKGTADEVIAKQAEAHVNTKRWAQEIRRVATGTPQPQPQLTQEQIVQRDTQRWVMSQVAAALNIDPERFPQIVNEMYANTQQSAMRSAWADFTSSCPDYADTPQNAEAIVDYLPQDVIAQQRPPSSEELRRAHAIAIYEKRYQPVSQQSQTASTPVPPIMPSSGGGSSAPEANLMKMPMAQLKAMAEEAIRNGQ